MKYPGVRLSLLQALSGIPQNGYRPSSNNHFHQQTLADARSQVGWRKARSLLVLPSSPHGNP
jgi:ubiquinone biosynthesis protein COQ9